MITNIAFDTTVPVRHLNETEREEIHRESRDLWRAVYLAAFQLSNANNSDAGREAEQAANAACSDYCIKFMATLKECVPQSPLTTKPE